MEVISPFWLEGVLPLWPLWLAKVGRKGLIKSVVAHEPFMLELEGFFDTLRIIDALVIVHEGRKGYWETEGTHYWSPTI